MNVSLKVSRNENSQPIADCNSLILFGVPYGNRTRVAAVKEKRFVGIQRKLAAWIAPYGSQKYSKGSLLDPYWTRE